MKKFVAPGVCVALLAVTAAASSHAGSRGGGGQAVSEYCASRNDLGLSHGACVAYLVTRNLAPHDAAICMDEGVQRWLGVDNHGQCVRKLGESGR